MGGGESSERQQEEIFCLLSQTIFYSVKPLGQLSSGDRYRTPGVAGHGAQSLFMRKQAMGHSVTN